MERLIDVTEVYPGDPEYCGVCISAEWRPTYPSHAWARAAVHIMHMSSGDKLDARLAALDFPYAIRRRAATTCLTISMVMWGPAWQRDQKPPVRWGFGKGWPGQ